MPRPKRTKVAPSGPARRAPSALDSLPATKLDSSAPKAPFNDMYDISDPEDRAATSVRHIRSGNGRGKAAATPLGCAKSAHAQRYEDEERIQDSANAQSTTSRAQHDNAMEVSSQSSPEVEVGRRERMTPAMRQSAIKLGKFERRPREPSILGRRDVQERSSSVDSDLAEDTGLTSVGRRSRRRRQPSLGARSAQIMPPSSMALSMERGTTPAHVGGSALKLGNFKRRAREPSILGTNRKPTQPRPDYDDEDDEEDDFDPEDESTPLNISRTKTTMSSSGPSGSSSKKRKLTAIPRPQSSPTQPPQRLEEAVERILATASNDGEEESENELPASPQANPIPSVERQPSQGPMSETLAPPQSSSSAEPTPEPELPLHRPTSRGRGRRQTRGRTPPTRTQDSPISSPPSLTHSPNRPYVTDKRKAKKAPAPPSTYSTAQLRALLPRRRRRRDQFDVPSSDAEVDASGLASDDDELSHLDARARRQPRGSSKTPAPAKKSTNMKPQAKIITKSTARRTYGRPNPASDKENEGVDPDDSLAPVQDVNANGDMSSENSQELEARVGKELKMAARKFQEVDKWEMEFEDVTAGSSSPKDAR